MNALDTDTIFHVIQLAVILVTVGGLYGYLKSALNNTVARVNRIEERQMDVMQRLSRLEGHTGLNAGHIDPSAE